MRRTRAKTTLDEGRDSDGSFRRRRGGRRKVNGRILMRWKIGSIDAVEDESVVVWVEVCCAGFSDLGRIFSGRVDAG